MQLAVDHDRGRARAIAETIDGLERHPAVPRGPVEPDTEAPPGVFRQRHALHRLTRLRPADLHDVAAGRMITEVVVEGDDAVDFRDRQVEAIRDHRHGVARDMAELVLYLVQDLEERPGPPGMLRQHLVDRGPQRGWVSGHDPHRPAIGRAPQLGFHIRPIARGYDAADASGRAPATAPSGHREYRSGRRIGFGPPHAELEG